MKNSYSVAKNQFITMAYMDRRKIRSKPWDSCTRVDCIQWWYQVNVLQESKFYSEQLGYYFSRGRGVKQAQC